MSKMFKFLSRYRGRIFLMLLLLFIQVIGTLYIPTLTADIVNNGIAAGNLDYVLSTGGFMLVIAVATALFSICGTFTSTYISTALGKDIRGALFRKVQDFSVNDFNRFGAASLITRTFENVKFGYSQDKMLMEKINIHVKAGSKVAIVGPTGAGKTTLVNLLMRFYEVNGGKISIDGINISNMSRKELRSILGMVLQDTWLFRGTVAENIAYGRSNATMKEIENAAKAARIDHFIRTLPHGYQTVLDDEQSGISIGQKQLLTIARVILTNPSILILDEATSSVDTRTEIEIQKAMNHLMQGRTSFVIAHRLSTIKDADMILVMKNGTIVEQGNHQQLLEKNGFYAELYNSQFAVNIA